MSPMKKQQTYPNGTSINKPRFCVGVDDKTGLFFIFDRLIDGPVDTKEFVSRSKAEDYLKNFKRAKRDF